MPLFAGAQCAERLLNLSISSEQRNTPESADRRPVLIFDGDCGFCRKWIARWRQLTDDRVEYIASQAPETVKRYPDIPQQWYREGVVLMEAGRTPLRCAEAVLRTLQVAPRSSGVGMWMYR